MYIPIKWARRKDNAWLAEAYKITYNQGAYRDYLYSVCQLEVGSGVDTPAEMWIPKGYANTLKTAQKLANEIEYLRQFHIRQDTLKRINDLDWERVNK